MAALAKVEVDVELWMCKYASSLSISLSLSLSDLSPSLPVKPVRGCGCTPGHSNHKELGGKSGPRAMAGGQRSDTLPRDIESQIRDSRFENPWGALTSVYCCTSTYFVHRHIQESPMLARRSSLYVTVCATPLGCPQSPSPSKARPSWVGGAAACICIRRGQHVIDLPSLPVAKPPLNSTIHIHMRSCCQLPVAFLSCPLLRVLRWH